MRAIFAGTLAPFVRNLALALLSSMPQVYETIVVFVTFAIRIGIFVRNALVESQPPVCFDRVISIGRQQTVHVLRNHFDFQRFGTPRGGLIQQPVYSLVPRIWLDVLWKR